MNSKVIGALAILGTASVVHGQMIAYRATGTMIRDLQEQGLLPTYDPGFPLQPTGFGVADTGRTGKIPEPETDDKSFQILKTGSSHQDHDLVEMTGGVEFMYHGYHVFANIVVGNLSTSIFTLQGEVKLIGKDAVVNGDQVTVDFAKDLYHAVDSKAVLQPKILGGSFIKPLYSHGEESYGSGTEQQTLRGGITSCDLLHPHYEIEGESINVRPGKRAIFRKARIKLFGRTILKIPYLLIPLDNKSYNNTPQVGYSDQEGYFIKTRYGTPLGPNTDLYTRLDYMSKLGVGIGADYLYKNEVVHGVLQVYTIEGPGSMVKIADQHEQKFAWGTLALDSDYENNNYLVQPGTVLENEKALLSFPQHNNAMTKLSLSYSGSSTGALSSSSESVGVSDQRKFGSKIATTVDVNYQTSATTYQSTVAGSPNVTTTQQNLNVKFDGTDDLTKATAELQYQRQIPIGSTLAVFGSNDMTPEVSLSSDAKRLMGDSFAANWPFKTSMSIGEFSDEFGTGHITRDSFDLKFQHPDHGLGLFHSDFSGEFRQGIFSDGTAQYLLNFADTESYRVSKDTSVNFHYNYLRPYGYSPLSIDQTGQQNNATADFSIKPIKTFSIGAQSGFDMLRLQQSQVAWQPVGVRMEWQPKDYLLMRTQATYDTFQGAWSNVRIDTSYKPGATFLSIGAYYDGINHNWSNINLFLDNLTWGKTKLSAILTWDGFTNQFDNQQYSLTYDLHCWEAVFTYQQQNTGFEPGRTVTFMFRLKALPYSSPFGTGTRGQPLGTGTGTSL